MRIAVLTTCTKTKRAEPAPAERLYTGRQHLALMRAVDELRAAGHHVPVWVASAGHGIVPGTAVLAPYEATFTGAARRDVRRAGLRLGMPGAFARLLAGEAEGAAGAAHLIVLCSPPYAEAMELVLALGRGVPAAARVTVIGDRTLAAFASGARPLRGWLPKAQAQVTGIAGDRVAARAVGGGAIGAKGRLAAGFLHRLTAAGDGR